MVRHSTAKVLKILVTNGILTILSLVLTTHKAIESGECCEDLQIVVKKARNDKQDPLLSILEWCNTLTEGMGASPAHLLHSRRTRTRLPVERKQLKPTLIEGVTKKMEKGKEKQKKYFDRQSRKLKRQAISFQCVLRVIQGGLLVRLLKSWVFDLTWSKSMEEDIVEFIYVRPQSSYLYKGYLSLRLPLSQVTSTVRCR